mmetsp:Transcript_7068/g.26472  ORF Transcript_7068/g.26472 Transcript_7068/m.26472 type:complete len:294 (-) Transcript_7068:4542-5423(-)
MTLFYCGRTLTPSQVGTVDPVSSNSSLLDFLPGSYPFGRSFETRPLYPNFSPCVKTRPWSTQPNGRGSKLIPLGQGKRKSHGPKLLISDQDLHFSADDWIVMHHFVAAFEHIETFTQSCQGSTYVTAGEFFRRLAELRNTLDSEKVFQRKLSDGSIVYHNVDDTGRTLHQTVRNMLQNFWTYFNDHVPIQELRLCSLLNPRTKGDSIHESLSAKVVDWDVVYQMRVAPQMRRVVEEKQLRFLCTSNADGFTHWLQKHYAELDQDDNPQPPQKRQRIQWPQYTEQDVENAMFRE